MKGLSPGFDKQKVQASFIDSFGIEVLNTEKIGENEMEIQVATPEGAQFAIEVGSFHSVGNEVHKRIFFFIAVDQSYTWK